MMSIAAMIVFRRVMKRRRLAVGGDEAGRSLGGA